MMTPLTQFTRVLTRVMFPALSRMQADRAKVKAVVLRSQRVIGLVTMPLAAGLILAARPFVLTAFGTAWADMIPILQVLCLVALLQPINATTGWIFQSQGRTDLQFRWTLIYGVLTLTSFAIGVRWGAIGVATAYALRTYLIWYPSIAVPGRLVDLTFGDYLHNLADVIGVTLVTALAVWGAGALLPLTTVAPMALTAQCAAGVLVYALTLTMFRPRGVGDLIELRRSQTAAARLA